MSNSLPEYQQGSFDDAKETDNKQDKSEQSLTEVVRKQVAEAVEESKQRFYAVWEAASDAMALSAPNGNVIVANSAYVRLFGYALDEIIGKPFALIFPPEERQLAQEQYQIFFQQEEIVPAFETPVVRADGTLRVVEARYSFLSRDGKRTAMLSIIRDITERKQVEDVLKEAEELFRLLLQSTDQGIYGIDTQGNCTFINYAGAQMLGHTSEDVIGQNMHILIHHSHADGSPYPEALCPIYLAYQNQQGTRNADEVFWRKDGSSFPVEYSSYPIISDSQSKGAVIAFFDITERKEIEQGKDDFISIVSHELKTPVTSIKGFTQILQRRFKKRGDEESLHFLDRMDVQLNKLAKLISDLLELPKLQTATLAYQKEHFNLTELVQEMIEDVQATSSTHQILFEGNEQLQVTGDRDRIGQVLINLLTNAMKYSYQANKVIVRLSVVEDHALLSVEDFGIGITPAEQQKIFERFYQTADAQGKTYAGLGIGLYISREIIKRHAGRIWVESSKGKGSTFYVKFPLFEGKI
jgi:PAS domain S-box-containing protein